MLLLSEGISCCTKLPSECVSVKDLVPFLLHMVWMYLAATTVNEEGVWTGYSDDWNRAQKLWEGTLSLSYFPRVLMRLQSRDMKN